jgi:hypothetical protein
MSVMHRVYLVTHGRDGATLRVVDRRLVRHLVEGAVEGVMAAVGHPCCGRGLGRLGVAYWPAHALLVGVMQWATRGERIVARIRLSDEEAQTLSAWWCDAEDV